jgi:hypothetical protein
MADGKIGSRHKFYDPTRFTGTTDRAPIFRNLFMARRLTSREAKTRGCKANTQNESLPRDFNEKRRLVSLPTANLASAQLSLSSNTV